MTFPIAFSLTLLPALVLAQEPAQESVTALIKKLGSSISAERQAATQVLQGRPESAPALRDDKIRLMEN